MSDNATLDEHQAWMYDAIKELARALTELTRVGTAALKAELARTEAARQRPSR